MAELTKKYKESVDRLSATLDRVLARPEDKKLKFLAMNEHIKRIESQFGDFRERLGKLEASSV